MLLQLLREDARSFQTTVVNHAKPRPFVVGQQWSTFNVGIEDLENLHGFCCVASEQPMDIQAFPG